MIGRIVDALRGSWARVQERRELRKYDRFTIAEYFRKQGARIGEGCSIIPLQLGAEPYLVRLGNRVTIAGGVHFVTHDGGAWLFRDEIPDIQVFGSIIIEDNCVVGQNAILMPNIRIGPNSIVAAGAVVISDVPPNTIAMGVPARALGSVVKYREKCVERWAVQKPSGCVIEPGATWWTSVHFAENRKRLREHLERLYFAPPEKPPAESVPPPGKNVDA